MIALAVVGLLFLAGCTASGVTARAEERDRTKGREGGRSEPTPVRNRREDLADDRPIAEAGGLDSYIAARMRPDSRFRFYTVAAAWCPACRTHDRTMTALQQRRGDVDYTRIDADGIQTMEPPPGIPATLMQYGECPMVPTFYGAVDLPQLEGLMTLLQRGCSRVDQLLEGEDAEEQDPLPPPPPPGPKSKPPAGDVSAVSHA